MRRLERLQILSDRHRLRVYVEIASTGIGPVHPVGMNCIDQIDKRRDCCRRLKLGAPLPELRASGIRVQELDALRHSTIRFDSAIVGDSAQAKERQLRGPG